MDSHGQSQRLGAAHEQVKYILTEYDLWHLRLGTVTGCIRPPPLLRKQTLRHRCGGCNGPRMDFDALDACTGARGVLSGGPAVCLQAQVRDTETTGRLGSTSPRTYFCEAVRVPP